jgi:hypothetical protein
MAKIDHRLRHNALAQARLAHQRGAWVTAVDRLVKGQPFGAASPGRRLGADEIRRIEDDMRQQGRLERLKPTM